MPGPAFDITVLGSSGGPLEGFTSSYLVKPASLSYSHIVANKLEDAIVAVDSGSGLGKVAELIADDFHGTPGRVTESLLRLYNSTQPVDWFTAETVVRSSRFTCQREETDVAVSEIVCAVKKVIQSYLITHAHMDHIGALVINSAGFGHDSGKHIYGLKTTVDALQEYVFNDHIWPNLTSQRNGTFLNFVELEHATSRPLSGRFTVTPYRINHGCVSDGSVYHSTAYLLEETTTSNHLLIFGDIESDSSSHDSATSAVWTAVAPHIVKGTLHTIVIECSTANLPQGQPSYGHLTPDSLFSELLSLNSILNSHHNHTRGLQGINILITHVKELASKENPRVTILNELKELNEKHGLKCTFTILLPGQTYSVA